MINIDIDTSDLADEFNLSANDVDNLMEYSIQELTSQFAKKWDNQAKLNLGKSRSLYRRSIQVGSKGRFVGVAYLNPAAWLPNAIEMGYSAFDMKQGFLTSSKVKTSKTGSKYLTIPFTFAQPGAIGESDRFSGVLPQQVMAAYNKQKDNKPLRLSNIPSQFRIPKSQELRKKINSMSFKNLKQNQTTSIYEGLQKSNRGGLVNFRRVSLNSDPQSWQHPGFEPRNLADAALNDLDIPFEVDVAIDNYLSQIGF